MLHKLHEKRLGKLVVISGFSGVGKGTVVRRLMELFDHYTVSVSMTTRKPRENEVHGVSYFFVENHEFEKMIREGGFYEYAGYQGRYYGTPKMFVDENREKGLDVILEIEVQGALQVKKRFPETVMIFVTTKNAAEMEKRLTNRNTESYEQITGRLKAAITEAEHMSSYDYVVINDKLDDCVETLEKIIMTGEEGPRFDPEFKDRFVGELKEIVANRTVQ